jgi:hypothetical protein
MSKKHFVIPDTQVKPDVPLHHLDWIGQYIVDKKPDVVIHLGDHYDLPSLSSWDKGKAAFEGRRFRKDVDAGHKALERLEAPLDAYNARRRRWKEKQWQPEKHVTWGNHEHRADRAAESSPELEGFVGTFIFDEFWQARGWQSHPFKAVIDIDGIWYSHLMVHEFTGNPMGAQASTLLKQIGHTFTQGHRQTYDLASRYVGDKMQRALIAGACLTPDHKVLTADLRYVPLSHVCAGDELVSFDETVEESAGRSRRYKTGTVKAVKRDTDDVFLVKLQSGKEFKATADHLWMTRAHGPAACGGSSTYQWRRTDSLRKGSIIPKLQYEWDTSTDYGAGYLAGMLDGEGCYYTRKSGPHMTAQLSFSQRENAAYDRVVFELFRLGCGVNEQKNGGTNKDVTTLRINGGLKKIAMVLGCVRPTRLLNKFKPEHLGRLISTKFDYDKVVSIEPLGEQEIVRIDIDAKTMIVEGYGHHNCYLHDEEYKGPSRDISERSGNHHWRGCVMKHDVEDGQYSLMELPLDFFCRRYEGVSLDKFYRRIYPVAA